MKIAIAGVISKPIIENPLGGAEAFTYLLIKGLVELGHDVTLYSSTESKTPAQHHVAICSAEVGIKNISNVEFVYPYTLLQIKKIIEDTNKIDYDILHINVLKTFMFSYFAKDIKTPILHTIHRDFFSVPEIAKMYNDIGINIKEHFCLVSNQAYQKSLIRKNIHYVFNGIDIDKFQLSKETRFSNYFWLSRIDPIKGPDIAIEAAKKSNVSLILSGDIDRKKYEQYFSESIKPFLNDSILYEPSKNFDRKLELFQKAKAFIFPLQSDEPFGLVVVEALSTGTPVIAFNRGAMSEIIEHGKTGFLVEPEKGAEGIAEAIKFIESMSPEAYHKMRINCRESVKNRFSYLQTARNYIELYKKIKQQNTNK